MKLSIVTTMYRSAPYLHDFYQRAKAAALALTPDYEFVFVNDGSPDDSLKVALGLYETDKRVRVVDLSRNFGHHKAMMAGLAHAEGDLVFLIDCDLEEPPELLTSFYERFSQGDVDVVYGVQDSRKDSLMNRIYSRLFYGFFNFLSAYPIPRNLLTVRLMSGRYVRQLVAHREQVFVISGLWEMTGFKQVSLVVSKGYKGTTTYNFARKLTFMLNAVTSFSNKPLMYIAYLGLTMVVPAGFFIVYLLIRRLAFGVATDGWTSVIVSLWFLGGLVIFILGVIAFYISIIFTEVKPRPYIVIRQVHDHRQTSAAARDPQQVSLLSQPDILQNP